MFRARSILLLACIAVPSASFNLRQKDSSMGQVDNERPKTTDEKRLHAHAWAEDDFSAVAVNSLRTACGVDKGEFLGRLWVVQVQKYEDAIKTAAQVKEAIEKVAKKAERCAAKGQVLEESGKASQVSKEDIANQADTFREKAESGLEDAKKLRGELIDAKCVEKFELKMNKLEADADVVSREMEALWRAWQESGYASETKCLQPFWERKISAGQIFNGATWASVSHSGDVFFQEMVKPMIGHKPQFEAQGPAKDYMKDKNGQKFFNLFRSAHVDPPGLSDFESFFEKDANGSLSFKKDSNNKPWNLLRIQAQSMKRLRDETLKLNSWDLAGKNVVITGMSSGIGFALAVRLAEVGAKVYGCARSRNFFDYSREAAITDGVELLREDRPHSGTAQQVAAALGTDAATVAQSSFLKLNERNNQGEQLYKMPQDHQPLYTGPFDVASSTFDNIIFDECDVRSHEHMDRYAKKLHDTHLVKQIDYLLINAQTETSFVPIHQHSDVLHDILERAPLSSEDFLKEFPDRSAGKFPSSQGIVREYQVGCKYLIAKLADTYGYDNFAQSTDIVLVSSIAGAMSSYHTLGAYSSMFSEYVNVKAEMAAWAKAMRTTAGRPLRINVAYPGVFQANINYGWICDVLRCEHPRTVVRRDWRSGSPDENGKFFAAYTTTGVQALIDTAWHTVAPSMTPGAEYASLQMMAMMRKNKALSGEDRMDVVVEGSPAQSSAHLWQANFGAAGAEIAKHTIYQDFADESANPTYQYFVMGLPNPLITEKTTRASRSWLLHAGKNGAH